MNTTEEKQIIPRTVKSKQELSGVWKLTYKLTNRMGAGGFSGRNLTTYVDPRTGLDRPLLDLNGRPTNGYFIQRQVDFLHPDSNASHANILDWLLGHPLVGVEKGHATLGTIIEARKESNPRIQLINLDHQAVENLEEEDYIDKLVGMISLDTGTNSVGLEKLRFILANLGLQYRDEKYIKDKRVEKQKLRKTLKDFARKGKAYAEQVYQILDDLQNAKYEYEIKEMLRLGIFVFANGMYKFNNQPIAATSDGVKKYFNQNPVFYEEVSTKLTELHKKELS